MALALRRPAIRLPSNPWFKPSGPTKIDWDHPHAKGLIFHPFDNGNNVVDLVSGAAPTVSGTRAPSVATRFGQMLSYNSSMDNQWTVGTQLPRLYNHFLAGKSWTICYIIYWNGAAATNTYAAGWFSSGGTPFGIQPNVSGVDVVRVNIFTNEFGGTSVGDFNLHAILDGGHSDQLYPWQLVWIMYYDAIAGAFGRSIWVPTNVSNSGWFGPGLIGANGMQTTSATQRTNLYSPSDTVSVGGGGSVGIPSLMIWDHAKQFPEHAGIFFGLYDHLSPSQQEMPVFNAPPAPDLSLVRLVGHTQIEY